MYCFKHCPLLSDICTRNQPKSSHQSRAKIRNDIAVKIFKQHHVKLFGSHHQLHTSVVDDLIVSHYLRVTRTHLAEAIEEEPIREFHDIRLVNRGDFLASFTTRILKSEFRDAS